MPADNRVAVQLPNVTTKFKAWWRYRQLRRLLGRLRRTEGQRFPDTQEALGTHLAILVQEQRLKAVKPLSREAMRIIQAQHAWDDYRRGTALWEICRSLFWAGTSTWPKTADAGLMVPAYLHLLETLVDTMEYADDVFNSLDRIDAAWSSSDAARAIVPGLIDRLCERSGQSADEESAIRYILQRIDESWERSDTARAMVPLLMQRLTSDLWASNAKELRRTLDLITAQDDVTWTQTDAARALVPELLQRLENAVEDSCAEGTRETLNIISPTWAESDAARAMVQPMLHRLEMVDEPNHGDAIRATLDQIDRTWTRSAAGRAIVPKLLKRMESYNHPYEGPSHTLAVSAACGTLRAVATEDDPLVLPVLLEFVGKFATDGESLGLWCRVAETVVTIATRGNPSVIEVLRDRSSDSEALWPTIAQLLVEIGDQAELTSLMRLARTHDLDQSGVRRLKEFFRRHASALPDDVLDQAASLRGWIIQHTPENCAGNWDIDNFDDFGDISQLAWQEKYRRKEE